MVPGEPGLRLGLDGAWQQPNKGALGALRGPVAPGTRFGTGFQPAKGPSWLRARLEMRAELKARAAKAGPSRAPTREEHPPRAAERQPFPQARHRHGSSQSSCACRTATHIRRSGRPTLRLAAQWRTQPALHPSQRRAQSVCTRMTRKAQPALWNSPEAHASTSWHDLSSRHQ
jgi:hypothetical protein